MMSNRSKGPEQKTELRRLLGMRLSGVLRYYYFILMFNSVIILDCVSLNIYQVAGNRFLPACTGGHTLMTITFALLNDI